MNSPLDNPVFNALCSGNANLAHGTERVKLFDEEVSPFAGFHSANATGFDEMRAMIPAGRRILYAARKPVDIPQPWTVRHHIAGTQFLFAGNKAFDADFSQVVALNASHADEMIALATLTRPGPFNTGTVRFGGYHGIFNNGKLVSMTGRRLHVYGYLELSAVCTHPDHTGKGYAAQLMMHQVNSMLAESKTPFLHVRADNAGAIGLYQKLGFKANGPMHFYFIEAR